MKTAVIQSRDELIGILNEVRPGQDFFDSKHFFDEGLLDSLDLTVLVAALESRYEVFMDVDEIVAENFCNLAAISAILIRKGIPCSQSISVGIE